MVLAHAVAALLIGGGIAVSDSAMDTYFCLALSRVGSGLGVVVAVAPGRADPGRGWGWPHVRDAGRGERFARWQRPRILTDLVVLQCRSSRGPPALALDLLTSSAPLLSLLPDSFLLWTVWSIDRCAHARR